MDHERARAEETAAMERVLTATTRVKAAFASLQSQFPPAGSGQPSQFALQTFDAALQELEETAYWLELLVESELVAADRLRPLQMETHELTAMLVACVKTAKEKRTKGSP